MAYDGIISIKVDADSAGFVRQMEAAAQRSGSAISKSLSASKPLGGLVKDAQAFGGVLASATSSLMRFASGAGAVYVLKRGFDQLLRTTIEVEREMTSMNTIFGLSGRSLESLSSSLFATAKNYGMSFAETAKAAGEFARQGLTMEQVLQRTAASLALAKVSGLSMGASVTGLTTIMNSFGRELSDSMNLVRRLASVDAAFAISAATLTESLNEIGSSAADARVPLNDMIGIVTAVQQATGASGISIGNSFKTMFARLSRPQVLEDLENVGVAVREQNGQILPMVTILSNLARSYDSLGSSQKSYIAESVGGIAQINILKGLMRDMSSNMGAFAKASDIAANATDQLDKRLATLKTTISDRLLEATTNLKELLSSIGNQTIRGPVIQGLESFNKSVTQLNFLLSSEALRSGSGLEKVGATMGQSLIGGMGKFITGPGAIISVGLLAKALGPKILGMMGSMTGGLLPKGVGPIGAAGTAAILGGYPLMSGAYETLGKTSSAPDKMKAAGDMISTAATAFAVGLLMPTKRLANLAMGIGLAYGTVTAMNTASKTIIKSERDFGELSDKTKDLSDKLGAVAISLNKYSALINDVNSSFDSIDQANRDYQENLAKLSQTTGGQKFAFKLSGTSDIQTRNNLIIEEQSRLTKDLQFATGIQELKKRASERGGYMQQLFGVRPLGGKTGEELSSLNKIFAGTGAAGISRLPKEIKDELLKVTSEQGLEPKLEELSLIGGEQADIAKEILKSIRDLKTIGGDQPIFSQMFRLLAAERTQNTPARIAAEKVLKAQNFERQSAITSALNYFRNAQRNFYNVGALSGTNTENMREAIRQRGFNQGILGISSRQTQGSLFENQFGARTMARYNDATARAQLELERRSRVAEIESALGRTMISSFTQDFDSRIKSLSESLQNIGQPGVGIPTLGTNKKGLLEALNLGISQTVAAGGLSRFVKNGQIDVDTMAREIGARGTADKGMRKSVEMYIQSQITTDLLKQIADSNKRIYDVDAQALNESEKLTVELKGAMSVFDFKQLAGYMLGVKNLLDRGSRRQTEMTLARSMTLMSNPRATPEARGQAAATFLRSMKEQNIPIDLSGKTALSRAMQMAWGLGESGLGDIQRKSMGRVVRTTERMTGRGSIASEAMRELAGRAGQSTRESMRSEFLPESTGIGEEAANTFRSTSNIFNYNLIKSSMALVGFSDSLTGLKDKMINAGAISESIQSSLSQAIKDAIQSHQTKFGTKAPEIATPGQLDTTIQNIGSFMSGISMTEIATTIGGGLLLKNLLKRMGVAAGGAASGTAGSVAAGSLRGAMAGPMKFASSTLPLAALAYYGYKTADESYKNLGAQREESGASLRLNQYERDNPEIRDILRIRARNRMLEVQNPNDPRIAENSQEITRRQTNYLQRVGQSTTEPDKNTELLKGIKEELSKISGKTTEQTQAVAQAGNANVAVYVDLNASDTIAKIGQAIAKVENQVNEILNRVNPRPAIVKGNMGTWGV